MKPEPTEAERCKVGLEMIEDISASAQSAHPEDEGERIHTAICAIYEIIHTLRSPACRKNHPKWLEQLDKWCIRGRKRNDR